MPVVKKVDESVIPNAEQRAIWNNLVDYVEIIEARLKSLKVDVNAHRASIVGITAKLDLDAGITDTDYASLHDPVADTTNAVEDFSADFVAKT